MTGIGIIKLIIIAPTWLQPSLAVLLEAEDDVLLFATFKSVGAYWKFGVPSDIVLLFTEREDRLAPEQVKRVLSVSSDTKCIVVAHDLSHRTIIEASGASEVLINGTAPKQILESIKRVAAREGRSDED